MTQQGEIKGRRVNLDGTSKAANATVSAWCTPHRRIYFILQCSDKSSEADNNRPAVISLKFEINTEGEASVCRGERQPRSAARCHSRFSAFVSQSSKRGNSFAWLSFTRICPKWLQPDRESSCLNFLKFSYTVSQFCWTLN